MASGDLGISHMGYCYHGCSNWIIVEGALSPELGNYQFEIKDRIVIKPSSRSLWHWTPSSSRHAFLAFIVFQFPPIAIRVYQCEALALKLGGAGIRQAAKLLVSRRLSRN